MSYAIIALNFISFGGLLLTAFLGYALSGELAAAREAAVAGAFQRHFVLALVATLVALFAESMIFFYFVGTGISIKKAVALYSLDTRYVAQTREFKQRTSGAASLAILLVIAAFVLGGGVAARAIPAWLHLLLAWSAVAVHGWSSMSAYRAIGENVALLFELDEIVRGKAARGEVQVRRTVV